MRSYRHICRVDRADGNSTPTAHLTMQETNVPREIKEMETYLVLLNKDGERRRQCRETISGLLCTAGRSGRMGEKHQMFLRFKEKIMISGLFTALERNREEVRRWNHFTALHSFYSHTHLSLSCVQNEQIFTHILCEGGH